MENIVVNDGNVSITLMVKDRLVCQVVVKDNHSQELVDKFCNITKIRIKKGQDLLEIEPIPLDAFLSGMGIETSSVAVEQVHQVYQVQQVEQMQQVEQVEQVQLEEINIDMNTSLVENWCKDLQAAATCIDAVCDSLITLNPIQKQLLDDAVSMLHVSLQKYAKN